MDMWWVGMMAVEAIIALAAGYYVAGALYRAVFLVVNYQLGRLRPRVTGGKGDLSEQQLKWLIFGLFSAILIFVFIVGNALIAAAPSLSHATCSLLAIELV